MNRRQFALAALTTPFLVRAAFATETRMEVFKSPTCGCCSAWIDHVAAAGFAVTAQDVEQEELWRLKGRAGITAGLSSCHTAFVEGYVIEGHVPAADIQRLLSERPEALGLSVPNMPIGSPGMEVGDRREAYDTLLVLRGGKAEVFQRHA